MKVDVVIPGAGRSGTTTLYGILKDHPEVCFSEIKEIHYFSAEDLYKRGTKYYHSFFKPNSNTKIFVSADTYLLIDYDSIKRIFEYNPQMKFIIALRDPVDRAYSSFNYAKNYGYQSVNTTFEETFESEKEEIEGVSIIQKNNLGHFYAGLYCKHISKWMEVFPTENFLFVKTSELNHPDQNFKTRIQKFLNLKIAFSEVKTQRQNQNAVPKNKKLEQVFLNRELPLRKILRKIIPKVIKDIVFKSGLVDKMHDLNRVQTDYEKLSPVEKEKYHFYFREDLECLEELTGINLMK